jgi:pimeloyl-ACP methyl ester carboxylesterase
MISQISRADSRAYRAAMRSLGLFNSKKRLHEISVPTLVITGGKDTTVPPVHQSQMAGWLPGARQAIINDAGHAISVEYPLQFNELLLNFLGV